MPLGLAAVGLAAAFSQTNPNRAMMVITGNLDHPAGATPSGEFGHHSWKVRNDGRGPLRLRTRFTSGHCGFSLWQGEYHFIPPGVEITVSLTWPTPETEGLAYSHHAEIWTNDPDTPKVKFRAFGITGRSESPKLPNQQNQRSQTP